MDPKDTAIYQRGKRDALMGIDPQHKGIGLTVKFYEEGYYAGLEEIEQRKRQHDAHHALGRDP